MQVKNRPFEDPTVYVPTEPFYGMLGLARRAGKVTPGTPSVTKQLKGGAKASLVLIDDSASQGTKSKLWGLCFSKGVPFLTVRCDRGMGEAIGISAPLAALSISDKGFAKRLISLCTESTSPQEGN
ncbi:MAG: ribosomal L7Ae/L30e/S12e/Gadd45 family protein [Clostridia bacterium]|nr:ribosomal L7Ae/L30e/S12e/Gadd45 family protein [Clostridia bacterium]